MAALIAGLLLGGCTQIDYDGQRLRVSRFWSDVTASLSSSCDAEKVCSTTVLYGSNAGDAAVAGAVASLATIAGSLAKGGAAP